MKRLFIGVMSVAIVLVTSCHQKAKGTLNVSVTYRNADKLSATDGPISKVYLMEVPTGRDQNPIILDSGKVAGNAGSFTLSGMAKSQEIYELVFGKDVLAVPLINDAGDIKVDVDLGKKDDFYTISGSDASSQLKELVTVFGKKNFELESSMADLDSLHNSNVPDSTVILAADARKNSAIQSLNTYLKQFINTSGNATLGSLALSWASRSFNKADFESSLNDLEKKFPDNGTVKAIRSSYNAKLAEMEAKEKANSSNGWVGKKAPDLALPDASGKVVSIQSFKGKYLLVDFWASWCGPCRQENPNVVAAYNQFKDKNFAILGVSLDKDKSAWQKAIQDDNLTWTHISDLGYWNSKAVEVFRFESIPFNVLIDPQGNIIGEGLRGDDLVSKLKEVLK